MQTIRICCVIASVLTLLFALQEGHLAFKIHGEKLGCNGCGDAANAANIPPSPLKRIICL